jgi:hypothetical protein
MAKKPEDRFQTPVELAAALAVINSRAGHSSQKIPRLAVAMPLATGNALADVPTAMPVAALSVPTDTAVPVAQAVSMTRQPRAPGVRRPLSAHFLHWMRRSSPRDRRWLILGGVGMVLALVGMALIAVLIARAARGTSPARSLEPGRGRKGSAWTASPWAEMTAGPFHSLAYSGRPFPCRGTFAG